MASNNCKIVLNFFVSLCLPHHFRTKVLKLDELFLFSRKKTKNRHNFERVSTGDRYIADCKLFASSNRHSPKSSLPVTPLKLRRHYHKVDTKCPDKLPLYLIRLRFSPNGCGSVQMTHKLQMVNYLRPDTDTLPS